MFAGRKQDSQVWKYFRYDTNVNKCQCTVMLDDESMKECGILVAGKNPTNLKAHLARHHQRLFSELKDEESLAKAAKRKREEGDGGMFSIGVWNILDYQQQDAQVTADASLFET